MQRTSDRSGDVDLERDRQLVDRSQRGDVDAFPELYLHYHDRLYRYCLGRLDNRTEAEDAAQEAFARAWKALPDLSGDRRFYPWLTVIASNLCVDVAKKNSRYSFVEEPDLDLVAPSVIGEQELLVDHRAERDLLVRALGNLSTRHRDVLELREGRNWTYQQIASHSNVAVSTVETLLFRARRSLRREFMQLARKEGALGVVLAPLFFVRRRLTRVLTSARSWAAVAKRASAATLLPSGSPLGGVVAAVATTALVAASIVMVGTTSPHGTPSRIAAAVAPGSPPTVPAPVATRPDARGSATNDAADHSRSGGPPGGVGLSGKAGQFDNRSAAARPGSVTKDLAKLTKPGLSTLPVPTVPLPKPPVPIGPLPKAPVPTVRSQVGLGTAGSYAVLAGTTVTNTGPSVISGNLGVGPGTAVTGFLPGLVNKGAQYAGDARAVQAQADLTTAYNDVAGRTPATNVSSNLGGQTLAPGVYGAPSALALTGTVTLDGQGNPNAVFIFQAKSTLITASSSTVHLTGGTRACNVFWQVGSSATLGTKTSFVGSILALTSATIQTGTTVQGRVLARNGQVSLDDDTITDTTCAATAATTATTGPTAVPVTPAFSSSAYGRASWRAESVSREP
jgi:RNA polymerase sigma factor (sigma-70 family)